MASVAKQLKQMAAASVVTLIQFTVYTTNSHSHSSSKHTEQQQTKKEKEKGNSHAVRKCLTSFDYMLLSGFL